MGCAPAVRGARSHEAVPLSPTRSARCSGQVWSTLAQSLVKRGYRVLTFDWPHPPQRGKGTQRLYACSQECAQASDCKERVPRRRRSGRHFCGPCRSRGPSGRFGSGLSDAPDPRRVPQSLHSATRPTRGGCRGRPTRLDPQFFARGVWMLLSLAPARRVQIAALCSEVKYEPTLFTSQLAPRERCDRWRVQCASQSVCRCDRWGRCLGV